MKFKKIRGIKMSYERQGMIFFSLANYKSLGAAQRKRIDSLIETACKGDPAYIGAMRAWLLEGKPFVTVSRDFYVNPSTMGRIRKKLYESW